MKKNHNFNNKLCTKKMTFEECELTILRQAVDNTEKKQGIAKVNNEDVKQMLEIVEDFLRNKKLICYGGTAINNILPKHARFYKRDIQIPDYDFFSHDPIRHAKELADIYYENGYKDVEAKSGIHQGTFKVFVNYIPVADITFLHSEIYKNIHKQSIKIDNIHYAPPDFLRMSMYLELSRPDGDVSRWEKVWKRLQLLNKHHPIKTKNCNKIDYSLKGEAPTSRLNNLIRNKLIDKGVIFFGGYSSYLYARYMPTNEKNLIKEIADYDVLIENSDECANNLVETLNENGYTNVKMIFHKAIGEIVPKHYEIKVNNKSLVFIYESIACHSYNKLEIEGKTVNVASIETILSFYLAFLYVNNSYFKNDKLLCISKFLFSIIEKNRLRNTGILKRFTINCYGKQDTLEDIRSKKAAKYNEFNKINIQDNIKEYEMWFLKYTPTKNKTKRNRYTKRKPTIIKSIKSKTIKNRLMNIFSST